MNSIYPTRIKICGITCVEDALMVVEAGADAVGLVFYLHSSRNVSIDTAKIIVEQLPPFINRVALFVDADEKWIRYVLEQVPIDTLQFHGQESEQACILYSKPYIKAIKVANDVVNLKALSNRYCSAKGLLLDTYVEDKHGGTGKPFNWNKISLDREGIKPIILAGGLNEINVKDAIKRVKPYAVDVSSGVESAKGIKDKNKVLNFMREVINA